MHSIHQLFIEGLQGAPASAGCRREKNRRLDLLYLNGERDVLPFQGDAWVFPCWEGAALGPQFFP